MADVRREDEKLLASEEPALTIGKYGSTWELRADGWYVNGEPYRPDEDGMHIPSKLSWHLQTPHHPDGARFAIREEYVGLREQLRICLVDAVGRCWHYDKTEVKLR